MMQRGGTSLPPRVQGPPKGQLAITLSDLQWASRAPPPPLVARIAWWGDTGDAAEEVPLNPGASSGVAFTLRSGPAHLARYLTDLGILEIPLIDSTAHPPKAVAKVAVDAAAVAAAGLDAPWVATLPATCPRTGAALGCLSVRIDVMYVPLPGQDGSAPIAEMARLSVGSEGAPAASAPGLAAAELKEYRATATESGVPAAVLTPPGEPPLPAAGTAPPPVPVASAALPDSAAAPSSSHAAHHHHHHYHTVIVRVESAFQLPPPPAGSGPRQQVYAAAVWQRDRSRRTHTHLAAAHDVPAAGGHAAVWRSELEVAVDATAFAEAAAGGTSGVLDGPLLLINVWRSGAPSPDPLAAFDASVAAGGGGAAAAPAAPTPFDRLIGCAALDLTALLIQAEIAGRFPLVNPQHEEQGCVKATVRPGAALAAALDALSRSISPLSAEPAAEMTLLEDVENDIKAGAAAAVASRPQEQHQQHTLSYQLFERPGRVGQQQRQQYAWSDSGSDDGDGMDVVGVSFEGAVSCDEDEMLGEDAGGAAGAAEASRPKLISDDWMFDISKGVGEGDEAFMDAEVRIEAMEVSFSGGGGVSVSGGEEQQREKKPVAFKNRLLPGVVIVGPDGIEPVEFAPCRGEAAAPAAAAPPPPTSASAARTSPRPTPAFHHPSLDESWLFGIGSLQQQGRLFGEPAPTPPAVTASQFAPMGGVGEGAAKTS